MASCIDFKESNKTYGPPAGMSDEECATIRAWNGPVGDGVVTVSKWKFNKQELEDLNRNGGEFFMTFYFNGFLPTSIYTDNPFAGRVNLHFPDNTESPLLALRQSDGHLRVELRPHLKAWLDEQVGLKLDIKFSAQDVTGIFKNCAVQPLSPGADFFDIMYESFQILLD